LMMETGFSDGTSGNWKFLKFSAGGVWRRSVGPIV